MIRLLHSMQPANVGRSARSFVLALLFGVVSAVSRLRASITTTKKDRAQQKDRVITTSTLLNGPCGKM